MCMLVAKHIVTVNEEVAVRSRAHYVRNSRRKNQLPFKCQGNAISIDALLLFIDACMHTAGLL